VDRLKHRACAGDRDHAEWFPWSSPYRTSPTRLASVERELRGQILDEYLADYEGRKGPISGEEQQRASQIFDEVFAEEGEWPAAS
jgi:hypothetical protein